MFSLLFYKGKTTREERKRQFIQNLIEIQLECKQKYGKNICSARRRTKKRGDGKNVNAIQQSDDRSLRLDCILLLVVPRASKNCRVNNTEKRGPNVRTGLINEAFNICN